MTDAFPEQYRAALAARAAERRRKRHRRGRFAGTTHVVVPHDHTWRETDRTGTASGEIDITESCRCGDERHRTIDRDEE